MIKIYTLSDPITKEIRYVGKTKYSLSKRLKGHCWAHPSKTTHCYNWITSLAKKGKLPIIELVEEVSEEDWIIMERYWISQFKTWGFNLTNIAIGGEGNTGYSPSEEVRKKLSLKGKEYFRNHPRKKSSIQKMIATRLANKIPVSEITRYKIGIKNKGRITGKRDAVLQYDLKGNFIKEWDGIEVAAKMLGLNKGSIWKCVNKKTHRVGNFKWEYKYPLDLIFVE